MGGWPGEVGAKEFPKPLTDETGREPDVIVNMGCRDTSPVYPTKRYLYWELEDSVGKSIDGVRPIIEEIDQRVRVLMEQLAIRPSQTVPCSTISDG